MSVRSAAATPGTRPDGKALAGKTDGRATRWAGHRARRRAEFVDAAITVIERDGPDARVDTITAELGVGRPALYRQFDDRADLDRAVAERAADLLVDNLAPRLQVERGVEAAIVGAVQAYLDWLQAHPHLYDFVRTSDAGAGASPVSRIKTSIGARVASIAREYLVGSGNAPVEVAGTLAAGIVGLVDAAVEQWRRDPAAVDPAMLTRTVAAMIRGAAEAVVTG